MLAPQHGSLVRHQRLFGFTTEELRLIVGPMATVGYEPIGSMGSDTPLAVPLGPAAAALRLLHPALRAGHEPAARRDPRGARHLARGDDRPRAQPARADAGLVPPDRPGVPDHRQRRPRQAPLRQRARRDAGFPGLRDRRPLSRSPAVAPRSRRRIDARLRRGARARSTAGPTSSSSPTGTRARSWHRSRRCCSTSAVHHHLVRERARTRAGLVVETGEAREVHHMALLDRLRRRGGQPVPRGRVDHRHGAQRRARRAHRAQGGPQLREGRRQGRAQGDVEDGHLDDRLLHRRAGLRGDRPRRRTSSTATSPGRPAGSAASASTSSPRRSPAGTTSPGWHATAELAHREIEVGGEYQWRREGEHHLFNPRTVFKLQHADARQALRRSSSEYTAPRRRPVRASGDAARAAPAAHRRGRRGARRCRSRRSSRSSRS